MLMRMKPRLVKTLCLYVQLKTHYIVNFLLEIYSER